MATIDLINVFQVRPLSSLFMISPILLLVIDFEPLPTTKTHPSETSPNKHDDAEDGIATNTRRTKEPKYTRTIYYRSYDRLQSGI